MSKADENRRYYADHKAQWSGYRGRQSDNIAKARAAILDPDTRDIVAIDGEGKSLEHYWYHFRGLPGQGAIKPVLSKVVETRKRDHKLERFHHWRAQEHIYTVLMASDGSKVSAAEGLSTTDCLDYLLTLGKRDRIIIGYAIQYDINMMLRDLSRERLQRLHKYNNIRWREYSLTWIPRKQFSVKLGDRQVTIWDIFGYFQSRFVDALKSWHISTDATINRIARMKGKRGIFAEVDDDAIEDYCLDECLLCVDLFRKLLHCCSDVEIMPRRYDGAGSIAAAILKKYRLEDYLAMPEGLSEEVLLRCYFGGRFEMSKPGLYDKLYTYDINSAYPAALLEAPCLMHAEWRTGDEWSGYPYAVAEVEWDISECQSDLSRTLGPFPHRNSHGSIRYPLRGSGYYWGTEVNAALALYPDSIRIVRHWRLERDCDHIPFDHLSDLYRQRAILKARGDLGHLVLKLGYNSEYGKTAQSLGGRGKPPKYRNWAIASWTTAHCRAKILDAIRLAQGGIISIATDGIISEYPVSLPLGDGLGQWKEGEITDAFLVRPNLYSYSEEGERETKAGGMAKKETNVDAMREAFELYGPSASYQVTLERFMGLGAALMRDSLHNGWRCWVTETKVMRPVQHNRIHTIKHDGPATDVRYRQLPTIPYLGEFVQSEPFAPKGSWGESFDERNEDVMMLLDSE